MAKRIVKLCVSLIIIGLIAVCAVIGKGYLNFFKAEKYGETFSGYLSESAYNTQQLAVTAYVETELTGSTSTPTCTGYRKVATLTDTQVSSLKIADFTSEEISGVDEIEIEYSDAGIEKSTKTYLVDTSGGYHYFVALQEEGEPIANSYFQTVLDGGKYLNCTSTTTLGLRLISDSAVTDTTYRQQLVFANDKVYFDQDLPGYGQDFYFEQTDSGIVTYLENPLGESGKFYSVDEVNRQLAKEGYKLSDVYLMKGDEEVNVSSLSTIEDIADFMFAMQIDSSYFVKTSYGFAMSDDKFMSVCKQMAGDSFAQEIEEAWDEYHVHFRGDYYVSDGRLSLSQIVLTMSNGDDVFALTVSTKYSDFGTSQVNIPKEN